MTEETEDKGFRVIDRRGGEAPSQAPPPPPEPPKAPAGGNPEGAAGVQEEKSGAGKGAVPQGPPQFLDLVESLQMGVMANLGMLQLPDGRRSPVNLREAQNLIDIIGILQEKTKGNLDATEEAVLRDGLYQLRMAFITVQKATIPDLGK